MKLYIIFMVALLSVSCTSIASVNWVERVGGDDRKKVWVPTCSKCGHVVNFNSTQCNNPKDRSLMVWRDKALYFDFPDNPQNDYKDEQLDTIDPREESDEVIVKDVEEDVLLEEDIFSLDATQEENKEPGEVATPEEELEKISPGLELEEEDDFSVSDEMEDDFGDLDWEESDSEDLFVDEDTTSEENTPTFDENSNSDGDSSSDREASQNSDADEDFENLDWDE